MYLKIEEQKLLAPKSLEHFAAISTECAVSITIFFLAKLTLSQTHTYHNNNFFFHHTSVMANSIHYCLNLYAACNRCYFRAFRHLIREHVTIDNGIK